MTFYRKHTGQLYRSLVDPRDNGHENPAFQDTRIQRSVDWEWKRRCRQYVVRRLFMWLGFLLLLILIALFQTGRDSQDSFWYQQAIQEQFALEEIVDDPVVMSFGDIRTVVRDGDGVFACVSIAF
jgi:hypothetical protein